jgi:DNA-binding LacI/PurR family transcriptional regulator
MPADAAPLPAQVMKTYKRLVQYFHQRGLGEGDRLPPQSELRQLLGKNNYTLSAAMQALVARGVLARKAGVGTVIRSLAPLGNVPWSLGVATLEAPAQGECSVFGDLTLRLLTACSRRGWRCTTYCRDMRNAEPARLDYFPVLAQDLAEGNLDGLVLLTTLAAPDWAAVRAHGVPLMHLLIWADAPCGLVIDEAAMVRQAVQTFAALGCRRFALASVTVPDSDCRPWRALGQSLGQAGLPTGAGEWLDARFGSGGGRRIATQLLARRPTERPDAVIVFDDYVGLGLAAALREAGSAYRPAIAVLVHRQRPLSFALPVYGHALDLAEMVERTAAAMQRRLLQPDLPEQVEFCAPRPLSGVPHETPLLHLAH